MSPFDVMMYRNGGEPVTLSDISISDLKYEPVNASAFFDVDNDGTVDGSDGSGFTWLASGNSADYEVKMVPTGGSTFNSGSVNLWENLGTDRSWSVVRNGLGTKTATGILYIKHISSTEILDQCNVTLEATVDSFA